MRSMRCWRRICFPPREDGSDPRKCPNCESGRLSLKLGKFGGFIGCTNYPECRYTRQLAPDNGAAFRWRHEKARRGSASGLEVTLRSGRFGPYLQLGEAARTVKSPSAPACRKAPPPDDIDLEQALGAAIASARSGQAPR